MFFVSQGHYVPSQPVQQSNLGLPAKGRPGPSGMNFVVRYKCMKYVLDINNGQFFMTIGWQIGDVFSLMTMEY